MFLYLLFQKLNIFIHTPYVYHMFVFMCDDAAAGINII